ncbi:hypothetical protein GCM10010435_22590 [Winogradskya consettensis]|uniref:SUKH-4 immunity protein n=1 Tax=Winogradskya consettensis TaxID=113560 RepID=A0A919VXM3_9ACTN|nr:SUKH-4 family immunity protein [Actinoplanes consettensis]GIM85240.1 hypothetical protein Aco04nite_95300 [Actinoplanes consettensis]
MIPVVRASEADVAGWLLPEADRAALISDGVPLIEGLVDRVSFSTGPGAYRLASGPDGPAYGATAETGEVFELLPEGRGVLINSSITLWLRSLHLVGNHMATSTALDHWDESGEYEDQALAELAGLLDLIRAFDPPAFGDGDHETHFWPAVLDRWLY